MTTFKELFNSSSTKESEPINVIPTTYKGIQFRSRLEARWAVFFDTLGIEWEYEPERYEIGMLWTDPNTEELDYSDMETYLPDFWLPELKYWIEVKGKFGITELNTAIRAVDGWSSHLPNIDNGIGGLMYLGDIPNTDRNILTGSHVMFVANKGVSTVASRFVFNKEMNRVEIEAGPPILKGDSWFDVTIGGLDQSSAERNRGLFRYIVKGVGRYYGFQHSKYSHNSFAFGSCWCFDI